MGERSKYQRLTRENLYTCRNFLMWSNESNLCWLNASMAIIAHNPTVYRLVKQYPDSQVSRIVRTYFEAMLVLNDSQCAMSTQERVEFTRAKLLYIQENTLKVLQPKMKYRIGEPDSAFCSLLNLLKINKSIENYFDITYNIVRECKNCGTTLISEHLTKPILTLTKVHSFDPENPVSLCHCPDCKCSGQKLKVVYTSLPSCVIFHFENGAGNGYILPLRFFVKSREYQLAGIMTLEVGEESSLNHFVSWIRYPGCTEERAGSSVESDSETEKDQWLECNDLNPGLVTFSTVMPLIPCKTVYMYIYQACDKNIGAITIEKTVAIKDTSLQTSKKNIECIDISDDEYDTEMSYCKTSESDESSKHERNSKNVKTDSSNPQENSFNITSFKSILTSQKIIEEKSEHSETISKHFSDGETRFENAACESKHDLLNILKLAASSPQEQCLNEKDMKHFKTSKPHIELQNVNEENESSRFKDCNQSSTVDKKEKLKSECAKIFKDASVKSQHRKKSGNEFSHVFKESSHEDRSNKTISSTKTMANSGSEKYLISSFNKRDNKYFGLKDKSPKIFKDANLDTKSNSTDNKIRDLHNELSSSEKLRNFQELNQKSNDKVNMEKQSNVNSSEVNVKQDSQRNVPKNTKSNHQEKIDDNKAQISAVKISGFKCEVAKSEIRESSKHSTDVKKMGISSLENTVKSRKSNKVASPQKKVENLVNLHLESAEKESTQKTSCRVKNSENVIDDPKLMLIKSDVKGNTSDDDALNRLIKEKVSGSIPVEKVRKVPNSYLKSNEKEHTQNKTYQALHSKVKRDEEVHDSRLLLIKKKAQDNALVEDTQNVPINRKKGNKVNSPQRLLQKQHFEIEKGNYACISNHSKMSDTVKMSKVDLNVSSSDKNDYINNQNKLVSRNNSRTSNNSDNKLLKSRDTSDEHKKNMTTYKKVRFESTTFVKTLPKNDSLMNNPQAKKLDTSLFSHTSPKRKYETDKEENISLKSNLLKKEPKIRKLNDKNSPATDPLKNALVNNHICAKSECNYTGRERPINDIIDIVADSVFIQHLKLYSKKHK